MQMQIKESDLTEIQINITPIEFNGLKLNWQLKLDAGRVETIIKSQQINKYKYIEVESH